MEVVKESGVPETSALVKVRESGGGTKVTSYSLEEDEGSDHDQGWNAWSEIRMSVGHNFSRSK